MASKWLKVSDNNNSGSRVILDSKKKRVSQSQIVKTTYKAPSSITIKQDNTLSSLSNKTLKRKRNNDNNNRKSTCSSSSTKTLLKNYSNFMKSSLPKRVLFSEDGEWVDFSQDVTDLVKQHFLTKTTAIEVKSNGRHLMLDILRMNELDLKSGSRKPIAWIDEKGTCFFPEYNSGCHESYEIDPEIKLHVEIELNENNNNYEECVEESNFKRVKLDFDQEGQSQTNRIDAKKADQCVEKIQIDEEVNNASPIDQETVRDMFMNGFSQSQSQTVDIIEVKKCSGEIMESRLDLFETQVEITKKIRGNANVKYGWFASPVGSTRVYDGLGHDDLKLGKYGYGVHLTPVHSAHISENVSDVDEKGVRCMVLCRVILGNMEVVLPWSKQFYPSNECFDSGVDNVENPNHYVVWNMNMNTHIIPEYTVIFKMSPTTQAGNPNIEQSMVDLDSSPNKLVKNDSVGSSTSRGPNSPWMPFSKLFEAISDKVASDDMNQVRILYDSLRGKKMSREEFIKNLRSIVGDEILRSTISSLQSKV